MAIDTSKGHPAMDYREHVNTYRGFLTLVQWMLGFLVILLIFMAYFLA